MVSQNEVESTLLAIGYLALHLVDMMFLPKKRSDTALSLLRGVCCLRIFEALFTEMVLKSLKRSRCWGHPHLGLILADRVSCGVGEEVRVVLASRFPDIKSSGKKNP